MTFNAGQVSESRRGLITIVDAVGLERTVCEDYEVVRAEYDRLLRPALAVLA